MRFGAFGEAAWVGERFRARGSCLRKWICAKAAKRVAERFLRGPAKSSCVDDLCALVARLPRRSERICLRHAARDSLHVRSFFLHSQKHVV